MVSLAMMSKLIILFVSISIIVTKQNVCTGNSVTSSNCTNQTVLITQDVNSYNITSSVGKEFSIKMAGNPTTGYGWYLQNSDKLAKSALKATNLNEYNSTDNYVSENHTPGMTGVGGYYYFTFKPISKTNENAPVDVVFVYKRPWETDVFRTLDIKVNIV